MLEGGIIVFAIIILYLALARTTGRQSATDLGGKSVTPQLASLLDYAARLYAERKYVAAEKAYLRVLRLDHKNTSAYLRLGAIYIAQKNYNDAIECYVVVSQIAPNALHFQYLGQAYLENRNHIKAIASLEKSIMFEASSQRYMLLARAYSKIANHSRTITALERAVELEPTARALVLLADAYDATKERDKAAALRSRAKQLRENQPHPAPGMIIGGPTA